LNHRALVCWLVRIAPTATMEKTAGKCLLDNWVEEVCVCVCVCVCYSYYKNLQLGITSMYWLSCIHTHTHTHTHTRTHTHTLRAMSSVAVFIQREVAVVVGDASPEQVQRRGHTGILSMNLESRMEDISTLKSSYPPPGGPGRRERGMWLIYTWCLQTAEQHLLQYSNVVSLSLTLFFSWYFRVSGIRRELLEEMVTQRIR